MIGIHLVPDNVPSTDFDGKIVVKPITLSYHNYFAVTCLLQGSKAWDGGFASHQSVNQRFLNEVEEYRATVAGNHAKQFHEEARWACRPRQAGEDEPKNVQFKDHLYNPCCWDAYGFADVLNLVLVDDVDPYFFLTAKLNLPINQVSIGFSPNLADMDVPYMCAGRYARERNTFGSLGSHWLCKRPQLKQLLHKGLDLKVPFVDLSQLLGTRNRKPVEGACSPHQHQQDFPLFIYAKLKLSGLANLGGGLLQRLALFRAISGVTSEVLASLKLEFVDSKEDILGINDSVDQTLLSIIDNQGSEEIALLINCTNYSVGIAIVQAIAAMTYSTMFDCVPEGFGLHDTYRQWGIHSFFADNAEPVLYQNHIFSGSHSVLGLSSHITESMATGNGSHESDLKNVRGAIEAYGRSNVLAGHFVDAQTLFEGSINEIRKPKNQFSENSFKVSPNPECFRFMVGRDDFDYPLSSLETTPPRIESIDFVVQAFELAQKLGDSGNSKNGEGILDVSTGIVVPVPKCSNHPFIHSARHQSTPSVDSKHYSVLPRLAKLVNWLFEEGPLSTQDLKDSFKKYRVPIRLVRLISHLLKEYRHALKDPTQYDSVLDLYDPILALVHFFTHDFQFFVAIERNIYGLPSSQRSVYTETFTGDLSTFIEAINNAFSHRIFRRSKLEQRDHSIDLRGGLSQIVLSSTTPMICSIGLLKKCWDAEFFFSTLVKEGPDIDFAPKAESGDLISVQQSRVVGVVTNLSLHLEWKLARVTPIPKVYQDKRAVFGRIDFSFGHILNPLEYVSFLHEAGHLILENWDETTGESWSAILSNLPGDRARDKNGEKERNVFINLELNEHMADDTRDWRSEVFCDLLLHLLVFGGDTKLAAKYFIIRFNSYALDKYRFEENKEEEVWKRFLDYSFRAFFITRAINAFLKHSGDKFESVFERDCQFVPFEMEAEGFGAEMDQTAEWKSDFGEFLSEFGPCTGWFNIWSKKDWFQQIMKFINGEENEEVNEQVKRLFIQPFIYSCRTYMLFWPEIWRKVRQLVKGHCAGIRFDLMEGTDTPPVGLSPWFDQNGDWQRDTIFRKLLGALETNQPPPIDQHEFWGVAPSSQNGEPTAPDHLGVICLALHAYIHLQLNDFDVSSHGQPLDFHVNREEDGSIDFTKNGKLPFLVEPFNSRLFSCHLEKRGARCGWEVALHRLFWDISSRLRARRLKTIIDACPITNWAEPDKDL